ncbi:MAG: DUF4411 family protein [Spirochaetota bacterium]
MAVPLYSIDSSSLIHGWREVYFPENFEGFWKELGQLADNGVLLLWKDISESKSLREECCSLTI